MEKSGFFNSSGGDRIYEASDFASYFGRLVSNGIFYAVTTNLKVTPSSGMAVLVAAGSAWINGYSYENTDAFELSVETANGVNPRIDRIVLRWSAAERKIYLDILTGAASATPVAAELTRTTDVYELCIAQILIPKGSIAISENNITDLRLDPSVCGLVNSLVSAIYE
ncbi:hypothetical protein J0B03_05565 [Alkalibacter rhizosphaerae]|uniref:Uncharacterized protein n=1 Tax=Alkalibacter rhizosphaerae TaxID=2815577 RepID=A0A974XIV9_9FIRM|nr:hypothetical protein [Alkalibacter rhizosphaerae]QSX09530.1 hypothetical protein J0B03_05565 [Alkalibacter rhizosphaerae]